jgi:hypothetical protein
MDNLELVYQVWNPATKCYEAAERTVSAKSWRLCKPSRPTKNPKHHPPQLNGFTYHRDNVRLKYFQWARDQQLASITDYDGMYPPHSAMFYGVVKKVNKDQYFAVEHTVEIDPLLA